MKEFTSKQKLAICDYFSEPNYPQPHGDGVTVKLLVAMIATGKYELEEYPRLAEAAVKLTTILVARFDDEASREVKETTAPKPVAEAETDSTNSESCDYDPIPF